MPAIRLRALTPPAGTPSSPPEAGRTLAELERAGALEVAERVSKEIAEAEKLIQRLALDLKLLVDILGK
jgi:hypothetical protein